MKRCTRCKRDLPRTAYTKDVRGRDGLRAECKHCMRQRMEDWCVQFGGANVYRRMRKFGLTQQEVEAYLQVPVCQICNEKFQDDSEIHFDHCHTYGHVRGVLCFTCNRLLTGTAAECIIRNERANDYLLRDLEVRHEQARAS